MVHLYRCYLQAAASGCRQDLRVVVGDYRAELVIHLQGLAQVEQVLRTPVASEFRGDLFLRFLATTITHTGQGRVDRVGRRQWRG